MFKKIILSPWTALLTLVLVLCVRIADPSFVESVRLRYFDTLITSKTSTENNVYTVNIDEAALNKYGQYPFPRDTYAHIIKDLYDHGAGLVVLNILYADRDRFGGDNSLGDTLKKYPVVLPNVPTDGKTKNIPRNPGSAVMAPEWLNQIIQYPGIIANVPVIENNAAGVGTVNTLPEIDGVNRRIPLIASVDGKLYPSLSMEILRVAAGDNTFQVKLNENGVEKMRIPKFGPVTTDSLGRIWIDYSQQTKSTSITELPKDFGGAIVIVGLTASGLSNPVPTSMGAVWPHEVQAKVFATMANNVVIQRPDYADLLEITSILVLGVVVIFLSRWTYAFIPVILFLGLSHYAVSYIFTTEQFLFDVTALIGGVGLVYIHAYTVKFVSEFLQKQQIKKQFGSYVNPTIVERLQKDPSLIKLGGEKKVLSIVMTDLRGFTTLGESFGDDVEGLTQIMNDYMTALSIPVLKNDGTLIKFIGDASLHVHGAPLDDPKHAVTAVHTAMEMIDAIAQFNVELTAKGKPPVGMGAGVNTGETLIGNIGAKSKFGYDVLGDSVSTAARLEGQTKGYGVLCIIGPNTNELVKDEIFTLELDCIAVKGKTVGLNIFAPLKTNVGAMPEYLMAREIHDLMIDYYREQNWDKALYQIEQLKGEFDLQMDHYYDIMIERIGDLRESNLPSDWDGVYRATTK